MKRSIATLGVISTLSTAGLVQATEGAALSTSQVLRISPAAQSLRQGCMAWSMGNTIQLTSFVAMMEEQLPPTASR